MQNKKRNWRDGRCCGYCFFGNDKEKGRGGGDLLMLNYIERRIDFFSMNCFTFLHALDIFGMVLENSINNVNDVF